MMISRLGRGEGMYVCMYVHVRYSAKKIVIVSRQVREPSHNSLCRQFSTKQSQALKPWWQFTKPCTVDHLYKHH